MNPSTINHKPSTVFKPKIPIVPLSEGLKWLPRADWLYQEKKDGVWSVKEMAGATLVGEQMRDGTFWAFDIVRIGAETLFNVPLRERWTALQHLYKTINPQPQTLNIIPTGLGGEYLEAILARGGEGVVAKQMDAPFGHAWFKCKRAQVFYCIVRALDPWHESVELGLLGETFDPQPSTLNPQPAACGKMPLRGGKYQQVRLGSILKIEAFGLTAKNQLREARPDHDTPTSWLVKL